MNVIGKKGEVAFAFNDLEVRRQCFWNFFIPRLLGEAAGLLEVIQNGLFAEAAERRDANITRGITTWDEVADGADKRQQCNGTKPNSSIGSVNRDHSN